VATISQLYVSNFTVITAMSQSLMLSVKEVPLLLESYIDEMGCSAWSNQI